MGLAGAEGAGSTVIPRGAVEVPHRSAEGYGEGHEGDDEECLVGGHGVHGRSRRAGQLAEVVAHRCEVDVPAHARDVAVHGANQISSRRRDDALDRSLRNERRSRDVRRDAKSGVSEDHVEAAHREGSASREVQVGTRCRRGAGANRVFDNALAMASHSRCKVATERTAGAGEAGALVEELREHGTLMSHEADVLVDELHGIAAGAFDGTGVMVDGVSPRDARDVESARCLVEGRCEPECLVGGKRHLVVRAEDVRHRREDLRVLLYRVVEAVDSRDDRVVFDAARNDPGGTGALDEVEDGTRAGRSVQLVREVQRVDDTCAAVVQEVDNRGGGDGVCGRTRHVDRVDLHVVAARNDFLDEVRGVRGEHDAVVGVLRDHE